MSKNKVAILEIIRTSGEHLTAEQVFFEMKKRFPSVSIATVYRNLSQLAVEGIIDRLAFDDAAIHFDKSCVKHAHTVCSICGQVGDADIPDITDIIEDKCGMPIEYYCLTIHYICDECKNKN